MVWKPHVTVAAIAEKDGRFLLIEERANGSLVLNQPAGHLEPGESLVEAAVRETREESAWRFNAQAMVGVYRWQHPHKDATFLRICFCGPVDDYQPDQPLDDGILRTLWLTPDEVRQQAERLRSPMVLQGIQDYIDGHRYPLEMLREFSD